MTELALSSIQLVKLMGSEHPDKQLKVINRHGKHN